MRLWPDLVFILSLALLCGGLVAIGAGAWLTIGAVSAVGIFLSLAFHALSDDPVQSAPRRPEPEKTLPDGFGRALLDQIPTPILMIAERGRLSYANAAAMRLLPRITIGEHFATQFRAPDFIAAVNASFATAGAQDVQFTLHQDADRSMKAQVRPLTGVVGFGPDPQVIVQLLDETDWLKAEARRSDFIANASHELRTPLASILGYIETLRGHARDDPAAQEMFLGIMDRQAHRMQRLVEDLMSLSRIEMSEHIRPTEQCDIHALVREVCSGFGPQLTSGGIELIVDLPQDARSLCADHDQMYQVFTNLIDNAIKYAPEDSEVIVSVALSDERFPGHYGITVTDQGPGIARDHLHRLTERFYRVSVAKSKDKGGTGLGLAIVKHILNRHRGELSVESAPGVGAQFTVWLPE